MGDQLGDGASGQQSRSGRHCAPFAISIATKTALSGIEWVLIMAGHVAEVRLDTVTLGPEPE